MKKIVEGVDYYQVVFTLPDDLSSLALGNRRVIFNLLFHSAWKSLKKVLEDEQAYEAAANMVLHTWDQKQNSHVHLHAVVPGGGPSLHRPGEWKNAVPPPHERQDRWWLVDADDLRHEFRKQFLKGLRLLHRKQELRLEGSWSHLQDKAAFETFLSPMEAKSWVTYIEPPPTESSQPSDIVKYLARYLTGGPISDARLVSYENGKVTFTARTGKTHGGSDEIEEVELPVVEFVRRWCLHILPHGFTKTRCYGGWSNHHCKRYVAECRELCPEQSNANPSASPTNQHRRDVGSTFRATLPNLRRRARADRTSPPHKLAGHFLRPRLSDVEHVSRGPRMIESIDNMACPSFARFPKPKPSLLRRTRTQSLREGLANLSVMMTASSAEIVSSFGCPLVVTISGPQATISPRQNSLTSLNSQGRAVTI